MSSHVVVVDSAARRHNIKVTPGKSLSEVLEDACQKLKLDAAQYGLKHNNKTVDLSRTFRLSGLTSGAKLELVQASKSAGVVTVALQLPESQGSKRLTDKFPSTTTLWLVLRKFEAAVATPGSTGGVNLTAQGAPSTTAGSGRLYYQQPVVQLVGRELASFTDLQKSLAQLGFNSGSTLLRLSFRTTQQPLEEALNEIQHYFDSVDVASPPPALQDQPTASQIQPAAGSGPATTSEQTQPNSTSTSHSTSDHMTTAPSEITSSALTPLPVGGRAISVFAPPSSSSPAAATNLHNESDYVPTVEHAQLHQKMLQQNSVNKRLPTDAEIEAQEKEQAEKLAAITQVEIRVRFPDQSMVQAIFGQNDSASDLYTFVRESLDQQYRSEIFTLKLPGIRGKGDAVPDAAVPLIRKLHLKGRVMLQFTWDRAGVRDILNPELRSKMQQVKAPDLPGLQPAQEDKGVKVNVGRSDGESAGEGPSGVKKLPKWLKGFTKK